MARQPNNAKSITTIDAIRMDLAMLEKSIACGDTGTAKRCVDAAESMFCGLRVELSGRHGLTVGPSTWGQQVASAAGVDAGRDIAPEPVPQREEQSVQAEQRRSPREEEARKYRQEVDLARDVAYNRGRCDARDEIIRDFGARALAGSPADSGDRGGDSVRRGWLAAAGRREWCWRVLGGLTWAWICCAAGMLGRFIKGKVWR